MKSTYHDVAFSRNDTTDTIKIERKDRRPVMDCVQQDTCKEIERFETITAQLEPGEFGRLSFTANRELLSGDMSNFVVCAVEPSIVAKTIRLLKGYEYRFFASYTFLRPNKPAATLLVFLPPKDGEIACLTTKLYGHADSLEQFNKLYNMLKSGMNTDFDEYVKTFSSNFLSWWCRFI